MYVDRSLRGYPKKYKLIGELKFKDCMRLNIKTTSNLFVGITYKKRDFIIHPECFDAKNIFSHPLIHNLKHKQYKGQGLSRQMKISLEKHRLENCVKHQIHQIQYISDRNGKTEYRGWTYARNEVVLQPGCIMDDFEFRVP